LPRAKPFNAETCAAALVEFRYTPADLVCCRNHGLVREFVEDYYVKINGSVELELNLSVPDLQHMFPVAEVVAALQVNPLLSCEGKTLNVQCW
jgi:sulfite oxidase